MNLQTEIPDIFLKNAETNQEIKTLLSRFDLDIRYFGSLETVSKLLLMPTNEDDQVSENNRGYNIQRSVGNQIYDLHIVRRKSDKSHFDIAVVKKSFEDNVTLIEELNITNKTIGFSRITSEGHESTIEIVQYKKTRTGFNRKKEFIDGKNSLRKKMDSSYISLKDDAVEMKRVLEYTDLNGNIPTKQRETYIRLDQDSSIILKKEETDYYLKSQNTSSIQPIDTTHMKPFVQKIPGDFANTLVFFKN